MRAGTDHGAIHPDNPRVNTEIPIQQKSGYDSVVGEFLATLSRELRSPLAPLRASLEMLKLSQPPGAAVQIMERQLGDMTRLVDDLTEMYAITRGGVELHKGPVKLDAILRSAVDAAASRTSFCVTSSAKRRRKYSLTWARNCRSGTAL